MNTNTKYADFELAVGTIIGADHLRAGRNNQDAFAYRWLGESLCLTIADGCGSGAHSELGAALGVRLVVGRMAQQTPALVRAMDEHGGLSCAEAQRAIRHVSEDLRAALRIFAQQLGADFEETISDALLFTLLGVWLLPQAALVFSLGDGVLSINGVTEQLGPFPNNQPPYLAYCLLEDNPDWSLRLHSILPREDLRTLVLATDGVDALVESGESISQLCESDSYFRNPDALRRYLTQRNRSRRDVDGRKVPAHLCDDTTIVLLRRNQGGAQGGVQ